MQCAEHFFVHRFKLIQVLASLDAKRKRSIKQTFITAWFTYISDSRPARQRLLAAAQLLTMDIGDRQLRRMLRSWCYTANSKFSRKAVRASYAQVKDKFKLLVLNSQIFLRVSSAGRRLVKH